MKSFEFLLMISIILLSTKAFGILTQKINMPQVVGAILAGIVLGPSLFNILKESEFISQSSEIGVILLMFIAGLETNLKELKKNYLASFFVALMGIIFPLIFGTLAYFYFFKHTYLEPMFILKGIFIGIVLTATSVSITVETLKEMGKLNGKIGTVILGAAIIDDIIGIIILTIITSTTNKDINIGFVFTKIILYFLFIFTLSIFIKLQKNKIENQNGKRRASIYFLSFCLVVSYISEHFFGISDITGAYFAGLLLCNFNSKKYVENKINILSYLIFSPIFFANIGIKTDLKELTYKLILFTIFLLIIAIFTKIIGCWIGAKICKFDNASAFCIGVGMVSRGEVALILAQKGLDFNLIDKSLFPSIVAVVVITTLITPVLLKLSFSKNIKIY